MGGGKKNKSKILQGHLCM